MSSRTGRVLLGVCCAGVAFAGRAQEEVVREDWFAFSIEAFAEWNDNRDAVTGTRLVGDRGERYAYDKTDVLKLGIGPSIHFYRPMPLGHLRAEYSPRYQWWDEPRIGQSRSEWTHQASVELRGNVAERFSLYVRDTFKYIEDPDLFIGDERLPDYPGERRLTEENSHYDNRLAAGWEYRLAQDLFHALDGFWRIKRYDEPRLADTGDSDEFGITTGLSRQHSAMLSYGLGVTYGVFDRESADDLEMGVETLRIGARARYRFSRQLDVSGAYGYQYAWHEDDEIDDRGFPADTNIEVTFVPTHRARMVSGLSYRVTEADVHPYVSVERLAVHSGLTYRHTARLSSVARGEFSWKRHDAAYASPDAPGAVYQSVLREGDEYWLYARLGFSYRWDDQLTLSGYYAYEDTNSDVRESYSRNVLGGRVRYEF